MRSAFTMSRDCVNSGSIGNLNAHGGLCDAQFVGYIPFLNICELRTEDVVLRSDQMINIEAKSE
jgi:hypothetical protein